MMAFIPPWAWRWIAVAGVGVSLYGVGWLNGRHHEELIFDDYKEQVKLAADKQAFLTQQTIKAHQALKEISDAEAKSKVADLTNQLVTAKLRLAAANASGSILPKSSAYPGGDKRLCIARDIFDQGYGEISARLQARALGIAGKGQGAVIVSTICKTWAQGLQGMTSPGQTIQPTNTVTMSTGDRLLTLLGEL